jgi:ligand-binding SRPBCC domain-containing protein
VFNATAPTPVTNREFTKALGVAVGRPAVIPVPGFAVRAAFGEVATELLSSHRVLPERAQERAFSFRFGRLENALGDICGTPGEKIYHTEQLIDRPVSEVFSFFCDAKNLEILTPPWLHFNVLGATDDSGARLDTTDIKQGMLIDYKLKIHGVPVKWRTMIERWQPPQAFVDTQLKGPYRLWHHTHEFIELPPQGGTSARTLMIDHVRYQEPLGALGQVAAGWFVDADVAKIFNYRRQKIKELFA